MRLKCRFLFLSIRGRKRSLKYGYSREIDLEIMILFTDFILSPLGYNKKLNEIYFMYIKHHTKISHWYLLVEILKIDIKYTFLVEFHIFSRNDRLFIYWCDVITRANMENYYQHIRWGKGLIKSRRNASYTFHL